MRNVVGVQVADGALLQATGTDGSITINGDVSGASATVSGSNFSFIDGIDVDATGTQITVGTDGVITLDGKGGSVDASSYTGTSNVFSAGVQIADEASVTGGISSEIIVDGSLNSGTTGRGGRLYGTYIENASTLSVGSGGTISLTGTTPGTSVTASATGNENAGLAINGLGLTTSLTVGTNGTLTLAGTGGSVDASADTSNTSGTQADSAGIEILDGTQITAGTGTGVTIVGTGGASHDHDVRSRPQHRRGYRRLDADIQRQIHGDGHRHRRLRRRRYEQCHGKRSGPDGRR